MSQPDSAQRIADNLAEVRQRIADAAQRNGREPGDVRLVGVTKYVDLATATMLAEAGCRILGESRPQELWSKARAMQMDVRWHLIGHLQRNKIRNTLPLVALIHSVDSQRLLEAIDKQAASIREFARVLLEVNISGDEAKHGLPAEEVETLLERAGELQHLHIDGLMGMSGLHSNTEQTRREFASLRELRDRLRTKHLELPQLSMGMSRDYEIAVEEGATLVRVGSALFQGIAE